MFNDLVLDLSLHQGRRVVRILGGQQQSGTHTHGNTRQPKPKTPRFLTSEPLKSLRTAYKYYRLWASSWTAKSQANSPELKKGSQ